MENRHKVVTDTAHNARYVAHIDNGGADDRRSDKRAPRPHGHGSGPDRQGRSRCWRCVAAAAVAVAVAGPTESADAASAPACAVVPPRRGRRPAPSRARPVGRRPRGRRRTRPVFPGSFRCSTARARSSRSWRRSARRPPRQSATPWTCSRRTDCSSTARSRLRPWRVRRPSPRRTASLRRRSPIGSAQRGSVWPGRARRRSRSRGSSTPTAWARSDGSPGTSTTSISPWSLRRPPRYPPARVESARARARPPLGCPAAVRRARLRDRAAHDSRRVLLPRVSPAQARRARRVRGRSDTRGERADGSLRNRRPPGRRGRDRRRISRSAGWPGSTRVFRESCTSSRHSLSCLSGRTPFSVYPGAPRAPTRDLLAAHLPWHEAEAA